MIKKCFHTQRYCLHPQPVSSCSCNLFHHTEGLLLVYRHHFNQNVQTCLFLMFHEDQITPMIDADFFFTVFPGFLCHSKQTNVG